MIKIQVIEHLKWIKSPEFEKMNKTSGYKTKKTILDYIFYGDFRY